MTQTLELGLFLPSLCPGAFGALGARLFLGSRCALPAGHTAGRGRWLHRLVPGQPSPRQGSPGAGVGSPGRGSENRSLPTPPGSGTSGCPEHGPGGVGGACSPAHTWPRRHLARACCGAQLHWALHMQLVPHWAGKSGPDNPFLEAWWVKQPAPQQRGSAPQPLGLGPPRWFSWAQHPRARLPPRRFLGALTSRCPARARGGGCTSRTFLFPGTQGSRPPGRGEGPQPQALSPHAAPRSETAVRDGAVGVPGQNPSRNAAPSVFLWNAPAGFLRFHFPVTLGVWGSPAQFQP